MEKDAAAFLYVIQAEKRSSESCLPAATLTNQSGRSSGFNGKTDIIDCRQKLLVLFSRLSF